MHSPLVQEGSTGQDPKIILNLHERKKICTNVEHLRLAAVFLTLTNDNLEPIPLNDDMYL